jgi:ubiquinone/menaquinone biosynthesis C-methylase UbiE
LIVAVIPDPVKCLKEAARTLRPKGRAVVLDKFVPEGRLAPWWLRLFRPLLSLLATEITRQLGPIVAESGMRITHQEAAGLRGLFQIAVLHRKAKES